MAERGSKYGVYGNWNRNKGFLGTFFYVKQNQNLNWNMDKCGVLKIKF